MRTWRKLYSKILESEQVASLSDGAAFLLTLLIVAQDDSGYWPWTATKIRRLVAVRPRWTIEDATSFAEELVGAKVASWLEGGIILSAGEGLNGRFRPDTDPEYYPRSEPDTGRILPVPEPDTGRILPVPEPDTGRLLPVPPRAEQSKSRVRAEQSKSRVRAEQSKRSRGPSIKSLITPEFLKEMAIEFQPTNIEREYKKCKLWWEEHENKEPSKLALRNWLEKAEKIRLKEQQEIKNGRPPEDNPPPGEGPLANSGQWASIHSGPKD